MARLKTHMTGRSNTSYKTKYQELKKKYTALLESKIPNNSETPKTKILTNPKTSKIESNGDTKKEETPQSESALDEENNQPEELEVGGTTEKKKEESPPKEEIKGTQEPQGEPDVNKCGDCGAVVNSSLICECGADYNG